MHLTYMDGSEVHKTILEQSVRTTAEIAAANKKLAVGIHRDVTTELEAKDGQIEKLIKGKAE